MGNFEFGSGTIYITDPETGAHTVLGRIDKLAEAPALEGYPVEMEYVSPIKEKVEIELKIQVKKMTRKKFIKWLMSHGYGRNEAQDCAWYFNGLGLPYSSARFYIMAF